MSYGRQDTIKRIVEMYDENLTMSYGRQDTIKKIVETYDSNLTCKLWKTRHNQEANETQAMTQN